MIFLPPEIPTEFKSLKWNVVMFDAGDPDWLNAKDKTIAYGLSATEAYKMYGKLTRNTHRMAYMLELSKSTPIPTEVYYGRGSRTNALGGGRRMIWM